MLSKSDSTQIKDPTNDHWWLHNQRIGDEWLMMETIRPSFNSTNSSSLLATLSPVLNNQLCSDLYLARLLWVVRNVALVLLHSWWENWRSAFWNFHLMATSCPEVRKSDKNNSNRSGWPITTPISLAIIFLSHSHWWNIIHCGSEEWIIIRLRLVRNVQLAFIVQVANDWDLFFFTPVMKCSSLCNTYAHFYPERKKRGHLEEVSVVDIDSACAWARGRTFNKWRELWSIL